MAPKTQHINTAHVQAIETNHYSTTWGMHAKGAKLQHIINDTQQLGILWPAHVSETVEVSCNAIQQVRSALKSKRPGLTWDDLQAPDLSTRIRTAAVDDSLQSLSLNKVSQEILSLALNHTIQAVSAEAPKVLDQVIKYAKDHAEDRDLIAITGNLPSQLQDKLGKWRYVSQAHQQLIQLIDPETYDQLERNSDAHRLHEWTDEQWLALHTEQDTLTEYAKNVEWMKWAIRYNIPVSPATSAAEIHARTKRANDIGADYNRNHRKTRLY